MAGGRGCDLCGDTACVWLLLLRSLCAVARSPRTDWSLQSSQRRDPWHSSSASLFRTWNSLEWILGFRGSLDTVRTTEEIIFFLVFFHFFLVVSPYFIYFLFSLFFHISVSPLFIVCICLILCFLFSFISVTTYCVFYRNLVLKSTLIYIYSFSKFFFPSFLLSSFHFVTHFHDHTTISLRNRIIKQQSMPTLCPILFTKCCCVLYSLPNFILVYVHLKHNSFYFVICIYIYLHTYIYTPHTHTHTHTHTPYTVI